MEIVFGIVLLIIVLSIFTILVDVARHQRLAVDLLTEIYQPGSVYGTFDAENDPAPKEWWG